MPRNEEKKAFMGIGRLCVVLVIALLLAWFLLPVFRGIVNIGNAAGILLCSFALWLAGYPGAAGCSPACGGIRAARCFFPLPPWRWARSLCLER